MSNSNPNAWTDHFRGDSWHLTFDTSPISKQWSGGWDLGEETKNIYEYLQTNSKLFRRVEMSAETLHPLMFNGVARKISGFDGEDHYVLGKDPQVCAEIIVNPDVPKDTFCFLDPVEDSEEISELKEEIQDLKSRLTDVSAIAKTFGGEDFELENEDSLVKAISVLFGFLKAKNSSKYEQIKSMLEECPDDYSSAIDKFISNIPLIIREEFVQPEEYGPGKIPGLISKTANNVATMSKDTYEAWTGKQSVDNINPCGIIEITEANAPMEYLNEQWEEGETGFPPDTTTSYFTKGALEQHLLEESLKEQEADKLKKMIFGTPDKS